MWRWGGGGGVTYRGVGAVEVEAEDAVLVGFGEGCFGEMVGVGGHDGLVGNVYVVCGIVWRVMFGVGCKAMKEDVFGVWMLMERERR